MNNVSITDKELLQYAVENGILDTELMRQKIEMQKREEMLNRHPYEIYKGKDGNWYTYLPTEDGRKKLKSRDKEKIKDKVCDFWREKEENPTVSEIYEEWVSRKCEYGEISRASLDRYKVDFDKYFVKIKDERIKDIDEFFIEDFIKETINEFHMTRKCFSNFRTLIYGIFKYAKRRRFVTFSITYTMNDMDISQNAFKKVVKKASEQVYMPDEKHDMEEYLRNHIDIINLGLLFMFKTGVRVGELATLKMCDIKDYTVAVNSTETRFKDESGVTHYDVKESPKSEAGIRFAILPDKYKWILDEIMKLNPNGTYLFEKNGCRIKTYSFRRRLNYLCDSKLHINPKSPHKIRKTYGTILLDGNVRESTIIDTMGHTDISCTKEHYYFDRTDINDKRNELNMINEL